MKPTFLALTLAALSVVLSPAAEVVAQEEKVARGTVSAIGGASLSVTIQGQVHTFAVDKQTHVDTPGGSTKSAQASLNGEAGPHLTDLLKVGQAVAVTYKDVPNPRASLIRSIPSASGGSIKTATAMRSDGTVQAVAADSLTISGAGGGAATFTQTFTIGPDTTVVGKGAGTAAAANGGKAPVTRLIGIGDRVSVSYRKAGTALHASDVRVTAKGSH